MAKVTGFTAERMLAIENSCIVGGAVDLEGRLKLTRRDGEIVDGGSIYPSKQVIINMVAADIVKQIHAIGDVVITTKNTSPASRYGGTWVLTGTGRTLVGVDSADADFNAAKKTGGAKTHTLTSDEMPSHTHTQTAHTHSSAAHTHTTTTHAHSSAAHTHTSTSHTHTSAGHNHSSAAHTHGHGQSKTQYVTPVGSSGAWLSGPTSGSGWERYTALFAATASTTPGATGSTTPGATGGTTASISSTTPGATGETTVLVNSTTPANTGSTTAVNASTGGGKAHNNLPPYLTVYFWEKTA